MLPNVGFNVASRFALVTAPPAAPSVERLPFGKSARKTEPDASNAGLDAPGQPMKLMPPKKKFCATKPFANGVIVKPDAAVGGVRHGTLPPVNVTVAEPGNAGGMGRPPSVTSIAV